MGICVSCTHAHTLMILIRFYTPICVCVCVCVCIDPSKLSACKQMHILKPVHKRDKCVHKRLDSYNILTLKSDDISESSICLYQGDY